MENLKTLQALQATLDKLIPKGEMLSYRVPSLWFNPAAAPEAIHVNPFSFWKERIEKIIASPAAQSYQEIRPHDAVIYNMFVRLTTAFDHNGNGVLDTPVSGDGLRETGTFMKSIALLPYLKYLGINTVYLLPITAIGKFGNKGDLGSPYAIRNPYKLDEQLGEPALGVGVEQEFKAFVEAAHHLGMKVVLEFVLRTTAKDSDWIKQHPDWFYWIDSKIPERAPGSASASEYGTPVFPLADLKQIYHAVETKQFDNLVAPPDGYRKMFTEPPTPDNVSAAKEGGYLGKVGDRTAKIPGAFADWPPDDTQPPWSDVTYLRMYQHPDFNYVAYNTIRMYDTRLARDDNANKALWAELVNIIPHYQEQYDVDGVMIDMGHAMPSPLKEKMIQTARGKKPDFFFWDENFQITEKTRNEGYNAVVGYLCFDQHDVDKHKAFLQNLATKGIAMPFFCTPENHNTPRAASRSGGTTFSKLVWVINNFLPGLPFLHAGFDVGEAIPVNTGLGFTVDDLKKYPTTILPLFSKSAYPWEKAAHLATWIHKVANIRKRFARWIVNAEPKTFQYFTTSNPSVVAFARCDKHGKPLVCVVANLDCFERQDVKFQLGTKDSRVRDLLNNRNVPVFKGTIKQNLDAGGCMILEL